jgi:hypothetical protein
MPPEGLQARVERWIEDNAAAIAAADGPALEKLTADFSPAERAYLRHLSEFGGLPGSKGQAFDVVQVPDSRRDR